VSSGKLTVFPDPLAGLRGVNIAWEGWDEKRKKMEKGWQGNSFPCWR